VISLRLWGAGTLVALCLVPVLGASAQVVVGNGNKPAVEVDPTVLERLGRERTLPGLFLDTPVIGGQTVTLIHPSHGKSHRHHPSPTIVLKPPIHKAEGVKTAGRAKTPAVKAGVAAPHAVAAAPIRHPAVAHAAPHPVSAAAAMTAPLAATTETKPPAPEIAKSDAPKTEAAKPETDKPVSAPVDTVPAATKVAEPLPPVTLPVIAGPATHPPEAAAPAPTAEAAAAPAAPSAETAGKTAPAAAQPAPLTPASTPPVAVTPTSAAAAVTAPSPKPPVEPTSADVTQEAHATSVGAPPPGAGTEPPLTVAFAKDGSRVPDAASPLLSQLVDRMNADPSLQVQMLAYASGDEDDSSKARRLSLSRALAVRSFLIDQGVRSARIEVRALGNKTPDGPPDRVDIFVQKR